MGSCVSSNKTLDSAPKRRHWFPTFNVLIHQTHIKEEEREEGPATTFQDSTYSDDSFFDSHACFESDCEDFFSVNGDFTPSRGSTPVHQKSLIGVPLDRNVHLERSPDSDSRAQTSPVDTQKRLAEFLHKSFSENLPGADQVIGTPSASISDSIGPIETTPNRPSRSVSRCLPSLPRSLSFGERKKRSPQIGGP